MRASMSRRLDRVWSEHGKVMKSSSVTGFFNLLLSSESTFGRAYTNDGSLKLWLRLYIKPNIGHISGIVISMYNTTESTFTITTNVNKSINGPVNYDWVHTKTHLWNAIFATWRFPDPVKDGSRIGDSGKTEDTNLREGIYSSRSSESKIPLIESLPPGASRTRLSWSLGYEPFLRSSRSRT